MPTYFPEQFDLLTEAYDATMMRLRKAAVAAVANEPEARMEKTYLAVLGALTTSAFGDVEEEERRYRGYLADQLENVCFKWKEAGGRIYDVENDRDEIRPWCIDPFEDLLTSSAFGDICYVHLGEVVLAGADLQRQAHISGFFVEPAELGCEQGAMLTFTCSSDENPEQDLGSMLRARSRTVQAWIRHAELGSEMVRPQVSGDSDLLRDRTLPTALSLAAGAMRLIAEKRQDISYG
ncbi:hypothetical protein G6L37_04295 [Agrobacterium rubi]|nr:hypothetical protein [Agrobacterium rubi]NTF24572.1 hypothetical protein [Agrobacterium rubi]